MDGPLHIERGSTGGSRRPVVALGLVVAFLALAIAKPWGGEPQRTADGRDPLATLGPVPTRPVEGGPTSAPPTPNPSSLRPVPESLPAVPGVDPLGVPFTPSADELWAVTRPRSEWGIRMVVFAPAAGSTRVDDRATLAERWIASLPDADGRGARARGLPALPGDLVMAVGLTAPGGVSIDPDRVRIWRAEEGDLPQRIPIQAVPGEAGDTGLFTAGGVATSLESWPRGSYRIDVLLPDGIARMRTVVPTAATAAIRGRPLPMGPAPELPVALEGSRPGLFVVSGPELVLLASSAGPALDEQETWSAGCRPGGGPCAVGVIESLTVSGVGVVLSPGQEVDAAVLELIGPAARRPHVIEARLQLSGAAGVPRSGVLLALDSPGPLESGVYRLTVTVRTSAGTLVTEHWHLEIAPLGTY